MSCKTLRECFTYDLSEMHPDISLGNSLSLCFTSSGALAVVLMRLSQYLWRKRIFWRAAPYLKRMNEILTGFECHLEAIIGKGLFLPHTQNLVIGAGVIVGNNVTLYNGVTLGALNRINLQDAASRYPMIGDHVVIYTGAKVIGPLVIGAHAVIGANSVVLDNVPESSVAVGVPARVLKKTVL